MLHTNLLGQYKTYPNVTKIFIYLYFPFIIVTVISGLHFIYKYVYTEATIHICDWIKWN